MKTIIIACSLLFSLTGMSQIISNINFDTIESETKDSTSAYFYPNLIKRMLENDASLTKLDYRYLYYGYAYTESYKPYGSSEYKEDFSKFYNKKKYKKAIPLAKKILEEDPTNLKTTYKLMVCFHKLEYKDSLQLYSKRYYSLLNAIYESGDGKSIETAYVVLRVSDEYSILGDLGLQLKTQALIDGPTDLMTVDQKSQKPKKGEKKIKEVYFNIAKPFAHMNSLFSK